MKNKMQGELNHNFALILSVLICFSMLLSCTPIESLLSFSAQPAQPQADVRFTAKLIQPLPEGAKLTLEILDDVTGIYFNSKRLEMVKESPDTYSLAIPLPVSSEVKYRYVAELSGSLYEFSTKHEQVRFRIARINGIESISDIVPAWIDKPYSGPTGWVTGKLLDEASNAPIPNLMVEVGGMQTFTASDGSFFLNGLVPGIHNLVVYSMDGAYETFQQGAQIAENANTPVNVVLKKRATTDVTFEVAVPIRYDDTQPVRFVSNLLPLGNAYADLSAGSAGNAVDYPIMKKTSLNKYSIKLELPVGFYLKYKYSLGDGFWNAELDSEGGFLIRDGLISEGIVIKDRVSTFTARGTKPIKIIVTAPNWTPAQESVFIQFNPFGWMEPLPMTPSGKNQWQFTLYSPLQYFDSIEYRYCRNGMCTSASEDTPTQRNVVLGTESAVIQDTISGWANLYAEAIETTDFLKLESIPTRPDFIVGTEFVPGKVQGWRSSVDDGLDFSATMGGNWVILTPTWTAADDPFFLTIVPSPANDLLWTELITLTNHVMMSNQQTIFFPMLNYTQPPDVYWSNVPGSAEWSISWNEQYARFLNHNAEIAQLIGAEGFVVGDPVVLTNTDFYKGQREVQSDLVDWPLLIKGIRERFAGKIIGVVILDDEGALVPDWISSVDMLYVLYTPKVEKNWSERLIKDLVETSLKDNLVSLQQQFDKPILIGVTIDSKDTELKQGLELQAVIYNAVILSTAPQPWANGIISRGYNPYVELHNTEPTIYKKPASEILWFWFHYLLEKTP